MTASYLQTFTFSEHGWERSLAGTVHFLSMFEVCGGRQASSPSLCASVRVVQWADETEQQLSRLAPSGCQLSADIRIFEAGLPETPGTDNIRYV